MGRQSRPIADGLVYHPLNRGNNRSPVFAAADDYRAVLRALAQTQQRYPFRLYGYCLMTNHFHLLLEPESGQTISRPFGAPAWVEATAQVLRRPLATRPRGRPRQQDTPQE